MNIQSQDFVLFISAAARFVLLMFACLIVFGLVLNKT